jgi:hypothetical protein
MNKQGVGRNNKVKVSTEWRFDQQPSPAFQRLLKLLLQSKTDERRERNGDEDEIK